MVGGIRSGASKQLPSDGGLAVSQLELSDPAMPRASPEVIPDTGLRDHRAVVQGTPFNRLVLDRWFYGGVGIPANAVGKHGLVLFPVFILFVEIPRGVPVTVLPASLLIASDLGRSPGFANFQNEAELGNPAGCGHHRDDASRVEQRRSALVEPAPVDSELGVVLASLVFGGGCVERETARLVDRPTRFRFSGRETWRVS